MATPDSIRFRCGACQHMIKVSAQYVGRKAKCPACNGAIIVPSLDQANATRQQGSNPARKASGNDAGLTLEEPVGYELVEETSRLVNSRRVSEASSTDVGIKALSQTLASTPANAPSVFRLLGSDVWGLISLSGLVFIWFVLLLNIGFGIDLLSMISSSEYDTPGDKVSPKGILIAALITTFLLLPLAVFRYRRAWLILTRGIRVPCVILKEGGTSKNEMIDVTFQYTYSGKTYTPKMSVHLDRIEGITHLLVDPEKPKRCMLE